MKTFEDLKFDKHPHSGTQAKMNFDNGFGISVLFGNRWYSNGVDDYEVGIIRHGSLCCDTGLCDGDGVTGYREKEEVTEIMRKLQEFPANIVFNEEERKEVDENEEEECDSLVEPCEVETVTRNYIFDLEELVAEVEKCKMARFENRIKDSFLKAKQYGMLPCIVSGIVPTDEYAGIIFCGEEVNVKIKYLPSHINKLAALQNLAKELIERIKHYNKTE